jgi:uncharacterized membrane protein YoaK (UPF0700 family)
MLSAEAYSFQLKSRLAISLSWVAGYTNVVTLAVAGHVVSHMTGNTTMVAHHLGLGRWADFRFYAYLIGMFLAGAVASGLMTEAARRRGHRSKYVFPIAAEAILLCCFTLAIDYNFRVTPDNLTSQYLLCGLATAAMGLQNATVTRISGAVVRTTHLTGIITDIGIEGVQYLLWCWDHLRSTKKSRLSRALRVTRRHPSFLRLLLLASILGSFAFGATLGTLVFVWRPTYAMLLPVGFLIWLILVDWRHPIADVRELDPASDPELRSHGIVRSLLPPDLGIYRLSFHANTLHRPPNFSQWAERVPRHWRVVILAISPLIRFDRNAALNLRAAAAHLKEHRGRQLVIAGITQAQYKVLAAEGITSLIDEGNLCTDIEFAVARALDLLHADHAGTHPAPRPSLTS